MRTRPARRSTPCTESRCQSLRDHPATLLRGRPISDSHDRRAAHEHWPGQSSIGQRIVIGDKIGPVARLLGMS
jgi:hypothetical protein